MAIRKLSIEQNEAVDGLLEEVRERLDELSGADRELLFAYRRRIYLRLTHDERGTPAHRKKLKRAKMLEQDGKCQICGLPLPSTEAELDRFVASAGYTPENTQLVHHQCHRDQQRDRGFKVAPK